METETSQIRLWGAVERGDVHVVQALLATGTKPNAPGPDSNTPLHVAVCRGDVPCVQALLASGATVNGRNRHRATPLHMAAEHADGECSRLLLQAEAKVNAGDIWRETPLLKVVGTGRDDHLRYMVQKYGFKPVHKACGFEYTKSTRVKMEEVCPTKRKLKCIRLLLETGANINATSKYGLTPLHIAVRSQDTDCINLLLQTGLCNVDTSDRMKYTALHEAVASQKPESVQLLLKAGAHVNVESEEGHTPLHVSTLFDDVTRHSCGVLLQGGANVNAHDEDDVTPVHLAALYGKAECVRVLVDAGADVCGRCREEQVTPLHMAVADVCHRPHLGDPSDRAACADLLLEAGADLNAESNVKGKATPLTWAVVHGDHQLLRLFLSWNCQLDTGHRITDRPLFWAIDSNKLEMADILLEAGANTDVLYAVLSDLNTVKWPQRTWIISRRGVVPPLIRMCRTVIRDLLRGGSIPFRHSIQSLPVPFSVQNSILAGTIPIAY